MAPCPELSFEPHDPYELGGEDLATINLVSVAVVSGVLSCGLLGSLVDCFLRRRATDGIAKPERGSRWAIFLTLASSYALLLPGLLCTLFSYNVTISLMGGAITYPVKENSESMIELIGSLLHEQLFLGCFLITLYSMLIPAVKVVLLTLGEYWRDSTVPSRKMWAARCIRVVQVISKWACPDLFAYILMAYLFRSVHNEPTLLSVMRLDIGFACFSVFCVGSTVATLQLREPSCVNSNTDDEAQCRENRLVFPVVVGLVAACVACLCIGLSLPSMELRLDLQLLAEKDPCLGRFVPFLEGMHLDTLMHAEVGVWECLCELARWILDGEMIAVIAFVMYAFFVLALTVVDCIVLLVASWKIAARGGISRRAVQPVMKLSRIIKKLSMLDVSIMGVIVVVMSLRSLRATGVIIAARSGLFALFAAEVCHYCAYHLVARAAQSCVVVESKDKAVDSEAGTPVPEGVEQKAEISGYSDVVKAESSEHVGQMITAL